MHEALPHYLSILTTDRAAVNHQVRMDPCVQPAAGDLSCPEPRHPQSGPRPCFCTGDNRREEPVGSCQCPGAAFFVDSPFSSENLRDYRSVNGLHRISDLLSACHRSAPATRGRTSSLDCDDSGTLTVTQFAPARDVQR